jgi:flagellar protein FlaG
MRWAVQHSFTAKFAEHGRERRKATACRYTFDAPLPSPGSFDTLRAMNIGNQPNVKFVQTPDYRETYANSVQIRVNVWDFFLVFGTMQQSSETQVELRNFQGIYLSPQQAKALMALLQQNVTNYEAAFGEIKLDPRAPGGPVH